VPSPSVSSSVGSSVDTPSDTVGESVDSNCVVGSGVEPSPLVGDAVVTVGTGTILGGELTNVSLPFEENVLFGN